MKTFRVLILEDDLLTLSRLLEGFHLLEEKLLAANSKVELGITVLSEYTQVEEWLNKKVKNEFDLILLDRDDKIGGSFHCLDFRIYPPEKIIGISSIPPYNEKLEQKGVTRIVYKDFENLEKFVKDVIKEVEISINEFPND